MPLGLSFGGTSSFASEVEQSRMLNVMGDDKHDDDDDHSTGLRDTQGAMCNPQAQPGNGRVLDSNRKTCNPQNWEPTPSIPRGLE